MGYGRDCTVGAYREAHACGVYQEKVPYATAVKYCSSLGMQICDRPGTGFKDPPEAPALKVFSESEAD